jgi:hypothetical protein
MTLTDVAFILAGGLIACMSVLACAAADRIRGISRTRLPRARVLPAPSETRTDDFRHYGPRTPMRADVIKILTTSGYTKAIACAAVDACADSERSTIESWTRAALGKANAA